MRWTGLNVHEQEHGSSARQNIVSSAGRSVTDVPSDHAVEKTMKRPILLRIVSWHVESEIAELSVVIALANSGGPMRRTATWPSPCIATSALPICDRWGGQWHASARLCA